MERLVEPSIHHIAIGARDVEVLACFYASVFGLTEITRHEADDGTLRSIWLAAGSTILMIERTLDELRHVEGVGAGPFLVVFGITPDERAAFEAELGKRQIPIEDRTQYTIYFRDPESNRVAVSHYPDPCDKSCDA